MNLRKNEGFLTSIPCIPILEYSQSNAPLFACLSVSELENGIDNIISYILGICIVNRCRLVMKLDKFLCFMFLFAFLALTLHKTRQKHAFFRRITNQKFRLIYSKLTCEPKTKDCAGHGRFNI